MKEMFKNSLTA